jgi:type II secretory pathway component PulF
MALYIYQALSRDGKRISGTLDAASLKQAHDQLAAKGLYPIRVVLSSEVQTTGFSWRSLFERPVSLKDKLFFTKQLQVLLHSGVPLLDALDLLSQQTEGRLKTIVITLRDTIKEGKSLADGLAMFPKTFEAIYIQLVRAGEASGRLDFVLDRLTHYYERQDELRKKVRSAMTYPLIQLMIIGVITFVLLYFVVPQMVQMFEQQKIELPLITKILMFMSQIMTEYYLYILAVIAIIVVTYYAWKATPAGARAIDALKLHIPIVRYFSQMGAVVQFSRTLGMLLEAGVGLAESLDIVAKVVDNKILTSVLMEAREKIIKQGQVAQYLKETNIFPPVAIYLINTGEQSGNLAHMLNVVGENYEKDLEEWSDNLTQKLNPIMLIVVAIIVGIMVFAIIVPIIEMGTGALGQISK